MDCFVKLFLALRVKLVASIINEGEWLPQKQNPRKMQGLFRYVKPRFHYIVSRLRLLAYAGVSVQTPVSTAQEIVPVPGDLGVGA